MTELVKALDEYISAARLIGKLVQDQLENGHEVRNYLRVKPHMTAQILDVLLDEKKPENSENKEVAHKILNDHGLAIALVCSGYGKNFMDQAKALSSDDQFKLFSDEELCNALAVEDLEDDIYELVKSWDAQVVADGLGARLRSYDCYAPHGVFLCLVALSFSDNPEHKEVIADALSDPHILWSQIERGYDSDLLGFIEMLEPEDQQIILTDSICKRFQENYLRDQVAQIKAGWEVPEGPSILSNE